MVLQCLAPCVCDHDVRLCVWWKILASLVHVCVILYSDPLASTQRSSEARELGLTTHSTPSFVSAQRCQARRVRVDVCEQVSVCVLA